MRDPIDRGTRRRRRVALAGPGLRALRPLVPALFLSLSSLSCARCGAPAAGSAEELLPPGEGAALSAPLGKLAASVAALSASALLLPGGDKLGSTARALAQQLGIDALSRDGLLAAGLDPDRGAALALLPLPAGAQRPPWVAALPLTKPDLFTQKLELLLQQRAGFPLRTEEPRGGVKAIVFARPGVLEKVGYALVRGYAVVARSADPAAELATAAARPLDQSLARAPKLAQARRDLGPQDLLVLTPEGSELLQRLVRRPLPGAAAAGLAVEGGGATLRVRIAQDLGGAAITAINTLLPAGKVLWPTDHLPMRDVLTARAAVAPSQLPMLLAQVPALAEPLARAREALKAKGADLDQDLFGALLPGVEVSLGLAYEANLGRLVDPDLLDVRARSPFDVVQVVAVAGTDDAARVRRVLAAAAALLPSLGATVTTSTREETEGVFLVEEWAVRYPGGEGVRFGLFWVSGQPPGGAADAGPRPAHASAIAFVTGGFGGFGRFLAWTHRRSDGLEMDELVGDAPVLAELDLGMLWGVVHLLPDSAFGSGPQMFMARSLVTQVIDPLRRLRARFELRPTARGVVVDLAVSLAAMK